MAVVAQKWHHQKKYSNLLFYVRMMGLVRELSSMLTVEISKFNKIQHLFQSQYITSKLLTEREFILALVSKFSTLLQIWYSNPRVFWSVPTFEGKKRQGVGRPSTLMDMDFPYLKVNFSKVISSCHYSYYQHWISNPGWWDASKPAFAKTLCWHLALATPTQRWWQFASQFVC